MMTTIQTKVILIQTGTVHGPIRKWLTVCSRSTDAHNEKQIELSREVAGPKKLRTTVNKYLTAVDKGDNKWKVIMLAPSTKCAEWFVEDHNGKVGLFVITEHFSISTTLTAMDLYTVL